MRFSTRLLAGVLALALLAACSSSSKTSSSSGSSSKAAAPTGTPIKIMQIATLSGPSNNVPQDADAGKAKAKAINDSGGIAGHPVDPILCDDKFDPDGADSAFFVVGAGAGANLTRAMRTNGFTGHLATSTQSITDQEIKDLGNQATDLLLVSAMPPPTYTQNSTVAQFDKDMKAAGVNERSGGMLLAWTSLEVVRQALEKNPAA